MNQSSIRQWRIWDYWGWISAIVLFYWIGQFLKMSQALTLSRIPMLGSLATFGLFSLYLAPFLLIIAAILALADHLLLQRSPRLALILRVAIVTGFLLLWLNLMRRVVGSWFPNFMLPAFTVLLPIMMAIIAIGFFLGRKKLIAWIDDATENFRFLNIGTGSLCILSAVYLLVLEPLSYQPIPSPVTNTNSATPKPHIFIITLDALATRDMHLYGYKLNTTPKLDELTKDWTVYENAHTTGTGTLASMPTLLTGKYPYSNQWSQYGSTRKGDLNLLEAAKELGYTTVHVEGGGWPAGLFGFHHEFDQVLRSIKSSYMNDELPAPIVPLDYELTQLLVPKSVSILPFVLPERTSLRVSSTVSYTLEEPLYQYSESFIKDYLASGSNKPLFTYMHMARPHWPYVANEFTGTFTPFDEKYISSDLFFKYWKRTYKPEDQAEIDRMRLHYDENILKADQEVTEFVQTLKDLGIYDESLIIITADHGTNFNNGYYGYYTMSLAAAEHQIPMLVKQPKQHSGKRSDALISNLDIVPTVLTAMGAQYPADVVDGKTFDEAEQVVNRVVYTRLTDRPDTESPIIGVLCGHLKLVSRLDETALFDLANDPDEQHNLLETRPALEMKQALQGFEANILAARANGSTAKSPVLQEITAC